MFKSLALAIGAAALTVSAMAQDSGPLLDALVKKGVLSDSEAEDIRVNLVKEYNSTSAGKLQISSFVKNLQLFGDARLRYQWQDVQTQRSATNGQIVDTLNNRYRYRVRLGATYTYDTHWSATVRIETGTTNDSSNADWGNYWDKNGSNDAIKVGQLFLTYKTKFEIFDETSTVADGKSFKTLKEPGVSVGSTTYFGRAPKQILLSDAFWSNDISPEGVAEELTFSNVGVDGLSFALRGAGYLTSNDQAIAPTTNTSTVNSSGDGGDGGLFLAQFETKYEFSTGVLKGANVRLAPLYMQESSGNGLTAATSATGTATSGSASGAGAVPFQGNFLVLALPGEFNWKSDVFGLFAKKIPQQVFGTYGANLQSNSRIAEMYGNNGTNALGFTPLHGNNTFWNAGYVIGQNKVKGDWSAKGEYRWIEAASYTSNLPDATWANGGLNQKGFVFNATYNVTDAITIAGTYFHSSPIGQARGAGTINGNNSYGNNITNLGEVDVLQADLVWKF